MSNDGDPTYRALLESMVDGVFIALHHRFVFANSAFPAMLGYEHDEFIGLPFEAVVAPEFLQIWNERYRQRVGVGPEPPNHYELRFLKRGGVDSLWIELRATRLIHQGERSVLGIVRDITERRRAEQALRESEAQYRFLIDHLHVGIVVHAADGSVLLRNARASSLLDAPEAAAADSAWRRIRSDGTPMPADEMPLQRALETHQEITEHTVGLERSSDGERRWLLVDAYPDVDSQDTLKQVVVTYSDITELKQAEARLRETQKMESLGTLAGGIAHDFNNALGAILGNVELARSELDDAARCLSRLDQISSASLRAKNLVRQILEFSHQQPHALTSQPMRPLVEDALGLLRGALPAGVRLDSVYTDEPLTACTSAAAIQQLVMALCTNAWRALEGPGGRIEIGLDRVDERQDAGHRPMGLGAGPYAHLWVSDNGCGMDAQTQARVFEPFFTTRSVGQGTGLGLSSVHGIVSEHGGTITVDSTPGAGSCFHVYLPLQAPAAVPAHPPAAVDVGPGSATEDRPRVMCIDDDEVMLLASEGLLLRAGYRVSSYSDPRTAVAALREQPGAVDVVVTDYNMPDLSGLDVAREVVRIRPGLPVVISSGYVTAEMRADAKQAGVAGVFNKEDSHAGLCTLVQSVLSGAPTPS